MKASHTALVATALSCVRGSRQIFSDINFSIKPGAALMVIGANGAGKTSLLRLLAGLGAPSAGRIDYDGNRAYLGHETALKPTMTVAEEMQFWGRLAEGTSYNAVLSALGLMPLAGLPCRLLSSGQKRRVALARVMASGAQLWILDEPTVGLDAASILNSTHVSVII